MPTANVVFTVFSGIGLIISLIPLWWHVQSWDMHVGTCMYMIWTALGCFVHFVDSIVWNGNVINHAPVWCDISSRIQIAVAVAWPACGLCITRRLYNITATTTPGSKRRAMIVDLSITIGIPLLQIVSQYVVSGHRFDIYEDYGCGAATWGTPLAFVLVHSWPLIIGLISACYGVLTIRASLKRRKEIRDLLAARANMTFGIYWRLIALASLDLCFTIPMATWGIVGTVLWGDIRPWVSWEDTHWGYSRVLQIPRAMQIPVVIYTLETTRWAAVLCAFVFFAFFGFVHEAKSNYRRLLAFILAKVFGYTKFTEEATTSGSGVDIPISSARRMVDPRQTKSTWNSDSFSDNHSTLVRDNGIDLQHKFQPYSSCEQSASTTSSSSAFDLKVLRVPEPFLDPASIKKTDVPDAFERV